MRRSLELVPTAVKWAIAVICQICAKNQGQFRAAPQKLPDVAPQGGIAAVRPVAAVVSAGELA
jgi:hypothetical protein